MLPQPRLRGHVVTECTGLFSQRKTSREESAFTFDRDSASRTVSQTMRATDLKSREGKHDSTSPTEANYAAKLRASPKHTGDIARIELRPSINNPRARRRRSSLRLDKAFNASDPATSEALPFVVQGIWLHLLVYIGLAAFFAATTVYVHIMAAAVGSIACTATFLYSVREHFAKWTTKCQLVASFVEGAVYMSMATTAAIVAAWYVNPMLGIAVNPGDSTTASRHVLLGIAYTTYGWIATVQELLKITAIGRIAYAPYVLDQRALWSYGVAVGCGFALTESIIAVLSGCRVSLPGCFAYTRVDEFASTDLGSGSAHAGSPTRIATVYLVQSLLLVPMHVLTGAISGTLMLEKRFLGHSVCLPALIPILLRGTVGFILAATAASSSSLYAESLGIAVGALVLLAAAALERLRMIRDHDLLPVMPNGPTVMDLIRQGKLDTVRCGLIGCCECCYE